MEKTQPRVIFYSLITLILFPHHLWDYSVGSASGSPLLSLYSFCACFSLWSYGNAGEEEKIGEKNIQLLSCFQPLKSDGLWRHKDQQITQMLFQNRNLNAILKVDYERFFFLTFWKDKQKQGKEIHFKR